MVQRRFWLNQVNEAWKRRSLVWLSGVRRVGKTFLSQSLAGIEYFDCELPRVRRMMDDPEGFLKGLRGKRIVLDEIHRLDHPSEILKIAADHYPNIPVLATGSSTLGASSKFRDTLAGRKEELWLTPMITADLEDFNQRDLHHRFLRGGLPPFFVAENLPEREFQEWMDAYWAKDIQELFRLERRHSFQKFAELLMAQSGGIFEATKFARACEVSRATISNYLAVLEATFVMHVVRPYSSYRPTEIVSAPKVYGFDTGFVCCHRGWHKLRRDDLGLLWEHFVLNEMHAHLQSREIRYWRDKRGHEVDFILAHRKQAVAAIECKWSAAEFDPANLEAFRKRYPPGDNLLVAEDVERSFTRSYGNLSVKFVSLAELIAELRRRRSRPRG
jgi:predicted AAA+ superfamily ATPase